MHPYIIQVSLSESLKNMDTETQRCLRSTREGVAYSFLNTLKDTILEQEEVIHDRTQRLLTYLNNSLLNLVEYEDIYTMILGLVEELMSTGFSRTLNL